MEAASAVPYQQAAHNSSVAELGTGSSQEETGTVAEEEAELERAWGCFQQRERESVPMTDCSKGKDVVLVVTHVVYLSFPHLAEPGLDSMVPEWAPVALCRPS